MVERTIDLIGHFIREGISTLLRILELLWIWSFGQIVSVLQSDWQALPAWKIVLLVISIGFVAFLLWKSVTPLWHSAVAVFHALIDLLGALISVLPLVIAAGLLAFASGWIIQQVNF